MKWYFIFFGLLIFIGTVFAITDNSVEDTLIFNSDQSLSITNNSVEDTLIFGVLTSNVTDPCTYSGSGNWNIVNTSCNITVNTNVLGNNFTISNSTVIINASITNYTIRMINLGSIVTVRS